jgi:ABC-2 type transport system ATP-binding protein
VFSIGVGSRGSDALIAAVRSLDNAAVETRGLALRRPSLDDVLLALTGHAAEEDGHANGRRHGRGKAGGRRGGRDSAKVAS